METRKEKYADYRASILSSTDDVLVADKSKDQDATQTHIDLNPSPLSIGEVIKQSDDSENKFAKEHKRERILWISIIVLIILIVVAVLVILGILLF